MANIQNQINAIKEKEYGEEIRGSIVDALLAVSGESADAKQATEQLLPAIDQATEAAQAATEAAKKAQDAAEEVAGTDVGQLLEKLNDYVPNKRTINNKPLSSDIMLSYIDVDAAASNRKINGHSLSSDITLTPKDLKNEPWTTYKTVVRDGWDINYIKIGYKQLYIRLAKTFTPSLNRQDNVKQTDKLPWEVPWQFKLSGTMMVATKYEMPCIAHMEGSLFTLTTIEDYPSPVSVEIYGVISVKEDLGDE